jgi:putative ABC transport system permease protein
MAAITARLEQQYPGTNRDVAVMSLKDRVVGSVRLPLLVLLGAVGFVLLIACANVAHMLLARGASRRREIAVRTALGASRGRIIRQLLTESGLLAIAGGLGGVALASLGIRVLVALSPADIPRIESVGLHPLVLAVALVVALITGLLFGLVPALQSSRTDLSDALRQGGGGRGSSEARRGGRTRSLLVASEFSLALVLLAGAGLMIRTFLALERVDPGFDPRNVLSMVVSITGTGVRGAERRSAFFQDLRARVQALPGVESASAINHLPLAGDIWGWPIWFEGQPIPRPGEGHGATYRVVLPGYFGTMRIPLLAGRDLTTADNLQAPGVIIVNERLASRFWPGENPIGKRMTLDDPRKVDGWLAVVGVAKDSKQDDWTTTPDFEVYIPYLQNRYYLESLGANVSYLTLVIRTTGDAAALTPAVREVVRALEPQAPLSEIQTMTQVVNDSNARPRFYLLLFAAFAAVAVALAAVGIYGVVSYSVSRRTQEIGIRIALGARPRDVLAHVVRDGMRMALAGAVAGVLGALALTRVMGNLLYGVAPGDPLTLVAVSVLLTAIALVASTVPAVRATKTDPLEALRSE